MKETTTLIRARVDSAKVKNAERVLGRLGLKMSDAINIFVAQIELRNDLPFVVTVRPERLISTEGQGEIWNEVLGEY